MWKITIGSESITSTCIEFHIFEGRTLQSRVLEGMLINQNRNKSYRIPFFRRAFSLSRLINARWSRDSPLYAAGGLLWLKQLIRPLSTRPRLRLDTRRIRVFLLCQLMSAIRSVCALSERSIRMLF